MNKEEESMSQEPSPADEPSTAKIDLRSKPQRSSQWRPFSVLFLFGGLLVIGAGTLLVWQFVVPYGQAAPSQPKSSAPTHPPIVATFDCKHNLSGLDDALRQELAAELHLTVAEVTAQIQAGKSLQDVAATQNVSADHLFQLEHFALKVTVGPLIENHCMSLQDFQHKYPNLSDADLNHDFTLLFS